MRRREIRTGCVAVGLLSLWAVLCGASWSTYRDVERANEALERGDAAGAAERYEAALKREPQDAIQYDLGTARLREGDLDGAVEALREVAADPGGELAGAAAYNLGNALMGRAGRTGADPNAVRADLTEAVRAYRQALARAPDDEAARRNLQLAATRLRDLEQQAAQQQPQSQSSEQQDSSAQQGDQEKSRPKSGQQDRDSAGRQGEHDSGKQQGESPDSQAQHGAQPRGTAGEDMGDGREGHEAQQDGRPQGPSHGEETAEGMRPEDVARILAAQRRQEAAVLREAMRRALGPGRPVEKDW